MNKNLKEQIIALKDQGLSYKEIQNKLKCSKGTISYHLGQGQKEKTLNRTKELRASNPLLKKKDAFLSSGRNSKKPIYDKIRTFTAEHGNKGRIKAGTVYPFTWEELLEKFDGKCYLTGRDINFLKPSEYQLDHIIPRSKGGPNTLDNCDFACKSANFAKGDLSIDEFKQLCLDVVNHFNLK